MPSGPRRLPRTGRLNFNTHMDQGSSIRSNLATTLEFPSLPRHIPFPVFQAGNDLLYDFLSAALGLVGVGFQYLSLYRTAWWLPNSHQHHIMKYYLVDPYLAILICLLLLRRVYYQVGCKLISSLTSNKTKDGLSYLSRFILKMFYLTMIASLSAIVLVDITALKAFCVIYLLVLYLPVFYFTLRPFFEVSSWCSYGIEPIHACSSNPYDIRRECEMLKLNFFNRLKQCYYTAAMNAYCSSLVPCIFGQSEIVYDSGWNTEMGGLIFIGSFLMTFAHLMPLRYMDIIHRAMLHAGSWERLGTEHNMTIVHEWKEDIIWPAGSVVRYHNTFWKALGNCNCVVPGSKLLAWMYYFFISPAYLLGLATFATLSLIVYEIWIIINRMYWYRILAAAILALFNFYPLYQLFRDNLISYNVYQLSEENEDKDPVALPNQRRLRQLYKLKTEVEALSCETEAEIAIQG